MGIRKINGSMQFLSSTNHLYDADGNAIESGTKLYSHLIAYTYTDSQGDEQELWVRLISTRSTPYAIDSTFYMTDIISIIYIQDPNGNPDYIFANDFYAAYNQSVSTLHVFGIKNDFNSLSIIDITVTVTNCHDDMNALN